MLKFHPAVFAVGNSYQIIVTTVNEAFVKIKIDNREFIDDSNGILKSQSRTHKFSIPQSLLDFAKTYTVIEKPIIRRLPYFSLTKNDEKL